MLDSEGKEIDKLMGKLKEIAKNNEEMKKALVSIQTKVESIDDRAKRSMLEDYLKYYMSTGLGIIAVLTGAMAVIEKPYSYVTSLAMLGGLVMGLALVLSNPIGRLSLWIAAKWRGRRSTGQYMKM